MKIRAGIFRYGYSGLKPVLCIPPYGDRSIKEVNEFWIMAV